MKPMLLLLMINTYWLSSLAQATEVIVKGLFNGAAVLVIDGQQSLVKEGKTKRGVTLIQANSKEAIIKVNGKQQRVTLSSQVGGSYQASDTKTVRIASLRDGHHWVRGQINDRSVDLLIDTGASLISMNRSTAKRLGVDLTKGKVGYTSTANGVVEAVSVNLNRVTIGEITHYNIEASVLPDNSLPVVLLGNSFLRLVDMRIENGVMILESN